MHKKHTKLGRPSPLFLCISGLSLLVRAAVDVVNDAVDIVGAVDVAVTVDIVDDIVFVVDDVDDVVCY